MRAPPDAAYALGGRWVAARHALQQGRVLGWPTLTGSPAQTEFGRGGACGAMDVGEGLLEKSGLGGGRLAGPLSGTSTNLDRRPSTGRQAPAQGEAEIARKNGIAIHTRTSLAGLVYWGSQKTVSLGNHLAWADMAASGHVAPCRSFSSGSARFPSALVRSARLMARTGTGSIGRVAQHV